MGVREVVAPGPAASAGQGLATLTCHLLGPPAVRWRDDLVDIRRRQVRALLYRLAAAPLPVAREHLGYLFWPDETEAYARRQLSGLLSHLRRALPAPELLVAGNDHVGLEPQHTWSDRVAFETWLAAGSLASLRNAVHLVRGPFLDGFSLPNAPEFEAWLSQERQASERRYLAALADLIDAEAQQGRAAAAIAFGRQYLQTDDLAEEIHRRLIELYALVGDRAAVQAQYEQCVAILERELGVSPLPETQAAYQAALRQQPTSTVAVAVPPAWTTIPGLNVPLVGRETSVARLSEAFAQAQAGRGLVMLISGDAGVGKSRLLQEFASTVQAEALVLSGAGYPEAAESPYQPLVEALRPTLRASPGWLELLPCCVGELVQLMPELQALNEGVRPSEPAGPELARTRLFEALGRTVLALADGPRPVLLCLDDLHWMDRTTRDWLAHMGRRLAGARLLILATVRSQEEPSLADLRQSLARQGVLRTLELTGLDRDAVLRVLQHLGDPLPTRRDLAERLFQITGGNPFFLLELLHALLESGRPVTGLGGMRNLPLPDRIREATHARLEHLAPVARQVLEAGAVLGQAFGFELVHLTSGRGQMETLDALDQLVARRLLEEQGEGYTFHHEIIRAVVYQDLTRWRRRLLHRRAGEILAQLQPQEAGALARHFEGAGEWGRAARYALQAGRAAKRIFAHAEARTFFERALTWLRQEGPALHHPEEVAANRRLQIEALYERGWVYRLLGHMGEYAEDLQAVAELAEALGDARTLAHLRWREAYTHRWFCRYTDARAAAAAGVALSQQAGNARLEAMCRREVALAAREGGDYAASRRQLERALEIFAGLDDAVYQIHVTANLATLAWYERDYGRSRELAQEGLARCAAAELPLQRRIPLGDLGAALAGLGELDQAGEALRESLRLAEQVADRTQEIVCRVHLGWLAIRQQQPDAAVRELEAGLALARRVGSCTEQGWLLSGLAEAHRLRGERAPAAALARQAVELAQATARPYDARLARRILRRLQDD